MKTAIDFYDRGKMKESSADEFYSGSYYFKGRFICSECGEPVHISKSRYSNFFSHFQKTDASVDCDRRVDGVSNSSIYERMGLPIYLRNSGNDSFNLMFWFKKIPIQIMNKIEKLNVEYDKNKTHFNSGYISDNVKKLMMLRLFSLKQVGIESKGIFEC